MSLTVSLQQEIIARFSELESANAFCLVVFFSHRGVYLEVTSQDTNLLDTETT